ncbi:hypothetical protein [Cytobacillus sp. AMY 15.2]|nr:hypothetical protein [Cytobacillus sp. AMY 15.2]
MDNLALFREAYRQQIFPLSPDKQVEDETHQPGEYGSQTSHKSVQ